MNWLRRNATRVPVEEDLRAPTPRTPVSPRVEEDLQAPRDKRQVSEVESELPESVLEEDSDESARSEDPSRLFPPYGFSNISTTPPGGSRKRKAEDDILLSDDSAAIVYNSSGVCPDIATKHNQRVTKRPPKEHLLHLPTRIQNLIFAFVLVSDDPYQVQPNGKIQRKPVVYYKIREHNRLVRKELKKRDGTPICKAPGLLRVCKQIRSLAIPIFYVGNSFNVHISGFFGEGIRPFWKRTECQRSQASIHLADSSTLSTGPITFEVAYEPNWQNLVTWLNACIKGLLPKYGPLDLSNHPEGHHLRTVAWLFEITDMYEKDDDAAFDKTIATHRGHLIRDDARWAVDDVEEDETALSAVGVDVLDNDPKAPVCVQNELTSSQTKEATGQYQAPRETLSSGFFKQPWMTSLGSDDVNYAEEQHTKIGGMGMYEHGERPNKRQKTTIISESGHTDAELEAAHIEA